MIDVIQGYLSDNVKIDQCLAAVAGGTSTQTSSEFDMLGYDSILVVAVLGTPAANNVVTLQDSATSGAEADTTATVSDATASPLVLDVQNVAARYIKIKVTRGTSTTIDQVILIRYNARAKAITQAATVKVSQYNAL